MVLGIPVLALDFRNWYLKGNATWLTPVLVYLSTTQHVRLLFNSRFTL